MRSFSMVKRNIDDYFSTLGPRLLIIADKPYKLDKKEIFDSTVGMEYLSQCFKSKFKSAETHVTYIQDCLDDDFCRKGIFSVLHHYVNRGTLNIEKLNVAFVGQEAFNAFEEDYRRFGHIDNERIHMYINKKQSRLELFDNDIADREYNVSYVILPSVDSEETDYIPDMLNTLTSDDVNIKSPYCTTDKMVEKFELIDDLFDKGLLNYFRFDMKLDGTGKRIAYFKVYDKCTNTELLYCPTDEVCVNDSDESKKKLRTIMKQVLIKIPVYNGDDTLIDKIKIMKFWQDVKVYSKDRIDEKPVEKESFVLTGDFDGAPSEWYDKWYNTSFLPVISKRMSTKEAAKEGYTDRAKYEWIYDIEVFKEDWLFVAKSVDGKNKLVCWNSPDKLREWIKNKILIGFNNSSYDDNVIRYAMSLPYLKAGALTVKQFSDILISGDKPDKGSVADSKYLPLIKEGAKFLSWDIGYHLPFTTVRNSLKKLTMSVLNRKNYDSSVPFDIDRSLTILERKDVEKYCEMDVDNTRDLFLQEPDLEEKKKADPNYKGREYASQSYDVKWNLIVEFNMTAKTLVNTSASFAGKVICGENAKPNLDNTVKFDPIVNDYVYYSIPELAYKELAGTELLNFYIKNQKNPDYIKEKIEVYLGGDDASHLYQFGFGGLHQALINHSDSHLVNMDVASLYPSLLILYKLMSRGASDPESYKRIYDTRIEAKHTGNKLLNLGLKLVLNAAIGAMLTRYNPLFDTWSNSTVCVHGQLLLFILVKRLYDAGFNIIQTNTDGIMINRRDDVDYMAIAQKWMEETRLVLEFDEIKILQQNNVNNYYCLFDNGKVKSKGFWASNEKYGIATSKILCNMVTERPLFEGIKPRDYVIFKRHGLSEICSAVDKKKLEGRSLAFVVGYPNDPRTEEYISISKNKRKQVVKDEKGKTVKDEFGEPLMEEVYTESKISGFTTHMLLVDDMNSLTEEEINRQEYVNFAKNLLAKEEEFGPYYDVNYHKIEEPSFLQALNPLKDNTDEHPTKAGVVCQNFLFECDYMTKEEQEEMIKRIEPFTYRIVWSGNRSYHIVVRLSRPVTSLQYKKIWYDLQYRLGIKNADEQANLPNKYTRVPDQENPKTGNMQTLYSYNKYVFDTDEVLDNLPKNLKDIVPAVREYKGELSIEALTKHIKRLKWDEGERFASCQKLSPVLISLVDMDELLKMIPCKLEKDHKFVIRSKYWYFQKHREELLDESGA